MNQKIVTRFAPSPTGYLHVGGLRTALYAYLVATKSQGDFILRIEDTDRERYVADGIQNILESLTWAHITPNQGVRLENGTIINSGPAGSYIQSERLPIYKKYVEELIAKSHAYYCFCTPERLEEVRNYQQEHKLPPGYDGHCLHLDPQEIENRIRANERHVVRLHMPDSGETKWDDVIRGEVSFKNSEVDDQVLLKSDGYPTYHLAVVVDDHEMNVTHVIRGEEWISSTPKHLKLYEYFGWTPPAFAHLPLLLNSDKSKLSKRQGDVAVLDYKTKGYLPEALINFVAFLGWNPGTEQELFTLNELVAIFSLAKVNKAGAVFNIEKLDWFNREYLKKLPPEDLVDYMLTYLPENYREVRDREFLLRLAPLLLERISKGSDLSEMYTAGELDFYFENPSYDASLLLWKKLSDTNESRELVKKHLSEIAKILMSEPHSNDPEKIKSYLWHYAETNGKGEVLWPLRVALSGKEKSPDPFVLIALLGQNESITRINSAIALL